MLSFHASGSLVVLRPLFSVQPELAERDEALHKRAPEQNSRRRVYLSNQSHHDDMLYYDDMLTYVVL